MNECQEFVDVYGDAMVAILAQEIDPSLVSTSKNWAVVVTWNELPLINCTTGLSDAAFVPNGEFSQSLGVDTAWDGNCERSRKQAELPAMSFRRYTALQRCEG